MLVGAGTIVNETQLDQAIEAGAKFIVSPGLNPDLVKAAQARSILILPGAVTPSEIMQGLKAGPENLQVLSGRKLWWPEDHPVTVCALYEIDFIPTGGISDKNLADYLENKRVAAVGGSWMALQT